MLLCFMFVLRLFFELFLLNIGNNLAVEQKDLGYLNINFHKTNKIDFKDLRL